ncbi:MAG TPA: DUF4197 domain-containing protein [Rhodocyclaceae bacterium]|nr:DUF4197 domain-containing protein [Rhodocyclaceae bacterium]
MKPIRLLAALALATLFQFAQAAGLADISNGEASSGLKEALAKGADFAVSNLGKDNGFMGNAKVKIPLPESLHTAEKAMRAVGMGKQADELVATMNHAAEQAVAQAKPVLMDSIKKMTLQDAKNILTGGDDAVTQYFRRTSSEQLTQKFMPIVKASTKKVQLADKYNKFAGKAANFGLISKEDADLDTYVTHKAMDGLFLMIAEEEKNIRQNPVAAGSALLKKVFGAL